MFNKGDLVILKTSTQDRVMKIQECRDEFIRAFWSEQHYAFSHESNFRHATPEEIKAGKRL